MSNMLRSNPESFRELYDSLTELPPDAVSGSLLGQGVIAAKSLMRPLEPYRYRNKAPVQVEDLWDFYSLSRISDYLLLPLQPGAAETAGLPQLSTHEYLSFFAELGFRSLEWLSYSPFYHEIVEVEQVEDGAPVVIEQQFWPGLQFGELLFSRADVRIRCPRSVADKEVAENSTLYFTHRRLNRKTKDLSLGWGHNSQWRTKFHRFYEDAEHYYFNVEGTIDLNRVGEVTSEDDPNGDIPLAVRRELLINRCFVTSSIQDDDLYPYDDTLVLEKP